MNAPRHTFPGGDSPPLDGELRVAFDKSAYASVIGHAVLEPEVEVCGVLVGQRLEDRHGPFLQIEAAIKGESARQAGAQVTFTHETWEHIHRELDKRHKGREIVGWYHTHGGFGIFLSEMDTFIHKNFFSGDHQIAYVFDPLAGTEGVFARKDDAIVQLGRIWVGGRERARPTPVEPMKPSVAPASDLAPLVASLKQLTASLEARGSGTFLSLVPWIASLALAALLGLSLFFAPRVGAGPSSAMLILEQNPATGAAAGIPITQLERVDRDVFVDAQGVLHQGALLKREGAETVLVPLVGAKPGALAPADRPWLPWALGGAAGLALGVVGFVLLRPRSGK